MKNNNKGLESLLNGHHIRSFNDNGEKIGIMLKKGDRYAIARQSSILPRFPGSRNRFRGGAGIAGRRRGRKRRGGLDRRRCL